jgi:hypothetical protein
MDASQWMTMTDPVAMLSFLRSSDRPSDRKFRLFAAACYRRVWPHLPDTLDQIAAEAAERHADGKATDEELLQVYVEQDLSESRGNRGNFFIGKELLRSAFLSGQAILRDAYVDAVTIQAFARRLSPPCAADLADLLRDIFGLLVKPQRIDRIRINGNERIVQQLAEAAYEERFLPAGHLDPLRLAILADALEEACAADVTVLDHLRCPGPHVRGCWPVDLILAKP